MTRRPGATARFVIAGLILTGACLGLLLQARAAAEADPQLAPTASIRISTAALLTQDARDLEVEVAHPAVRAKGIILFSHGANASPDRYRAIVAAWATGGYWVLSPLHLDSERHPHRETRDRARILSSRLEDMRTVIAAAARSGRETPLAHDLRNTARLPMFAAGHSYGAYIAQIAGGASVLDAAGARLTLAPQPRLRGVVALSPPPTAAGFSPPGSWSTLSVPMLVETGTTDTLPPFVTRWQQHLDSHADAPPGRSWPAVYGGIDHYFGGMIGRLSPAPDAAAERQLTRFATLSLSFMRRAASGRFRGFDRDISRLSDRPLAPAGNGSATAPLKAQSGGRGYSAVDEALYLQRFDDLVKSFATGVGLDRYDPLAPVPGRPDRRLPLASPAARTIAPAALDAARDYAAANNSSSLLIWRHGAIELEQYFGTTRPDTLLNSKSFAKPLTAIVIGRALQLGAITSLDQPVADFIPQWRADPRKARITVRHLLDMRTGFLPQAAAPEASSILNRAYLHPRHDEIIINDYPVIADPGTRYDYSNAASEMVSPLIRAATGLSYEEFVAREVLQRIGASGGKVWINRPGGTAHSGCCILLPTRDWLRLSVLLLNDGKWGGRRLLPKGFVAQMRSGTPQNPHFGLGVWLADDYLAERGIANPDRHEYTTLHGEPYQADDLFLFDGNANQVSYIVPSEGLVVLRMGAAPPRGTRWDNSVLPNTILRGITAKRGTSVPQRGGAIPPRGG